MAVAPAQSRRPPRRGLSPKRPRRSPPHCPQRSKNFATSRTGTNKYITPFNETTGNYPANLPPPTPGLQGSATFRPLRPPPKGRGDLLKRQKKKQKQTPGSLPCTPAPLHCADARHEKRGLPPEVPTISISRCKKRNATSSESQAGSGSQGSG